MELGLKCKNVLITGGSKGIGFACARAFRSEGARVAIVSRSQANLDAARKALGEAYTLGADLTDAAAATGMTARGRGPIIMLASAGLANAYASRGVRVIGLNPGLTKTDRVAEGFKAEAKRLGVSEEEAMQRSVKKLPLGRMAEPAEIPDIVVFAASERGRFLTGANITLDGAARPTVV